MSFLATISAEEFAEYRGDGGNLTYKQVFDFDRFGNHYRKSANNPTAGQQNPLAFTPIEESTGPGTGDIEKGTNRFRTGTTYDDAGQVVNDAKFRQMGFAYDANGRQVKATRAGVPDAWTVYDSSGNRVATKINNVWRYMVYDAMGKLVAEYGTQPEGLGGVKYVQQDWQGSVRTVTNANGFVTARTDHQAFGGEVGYGVGQRSIDQGYNVDKATRQGYGLTERDDATGQDHTWFRKNENAAGRWTSPDSYNGSMNLGDPQSFNRYSYVEGQPTNFVDPTGLNLEQDGGGYCIRYHYTNGTIGFWGPWTCYGGSGSGGGGGGGTGTGTGGGQQQNIAQDCIDALKDLGVWDKVKELLKNPPLINLDEQIGSRHKSGDDWGGPITRADEPGERYFGQDAAGMTAGEFFDSYGATALTDRQGVGGVIYHRSSNILQDTYLLLHEVTHLAFPPILTRRGNDLDKILVNELTLIQKKGESYGETVSRFFRNKCDKNMRHFGIRP